MCCRIEETAALADCTAKDADIRGERAASRIYAQRDVSADKDFKMETNRIAL
jgi:hypothetical protein